MIKVNKRFRKHFGDLSCEWCGKWSSLWPGVAMTSKNIEKWKKDFMPRVYQCKRTQCIRCRPEGWEEIGTKKK